MQLIGLIICMPFLIALGIGMMACPPWHCYGPDGDIYMFAAFSFWLVPIGLPFILAKPVLRLFEGRKEHLAQKRENEFSRLYEVKNAEWDLANKKEPPKWPKAPD